MSREEIVGAAVDLLDESGLDGLTLRTLASRLGVRAPTLYWHVKDKRHLLDLVAQYVIGGFRTPGREEPAPGQPVWDWLADRARDQRAALLAHRDSALVVAGNRPTADALPAIERTLGVLVAAGCTPGEAVRVLTTLGSFVIGDALETQTAQSRADAGAHPPADPTTGGYPLLTAAVADVGGDEERFEEGLGLLLGGLRARLEAREAAPPG
nr:TetR/AcrR family transcriptional regulator C-terminal domain-containing protein [Motilibacter deserti]